MRAEYFIYLIKILSKRGMSRFIPADGLCRCSYTELTLTCESLSLKCNQNCVLNIFLKAQKQLRNQYVHRVTVKHSPRPKVIIFLFTGDINYTGKFSWDESNSSDSI